MEQEVLYFSTTVELKMNGVTYRPAMCYKVPPFAKKSLQPLVNAGKVTFHEAPVHFVNGAISPMATDLPVTPVDSINEEPKTTKKKAV